MNSGELFGLKILKYYRQNRRASVGFTLLELIITVLILGILATLAIPSFLSQVGRSRETEAVTSLGTINRIQVAHRYEYGEFALIGEITPEGINESSSLELALKPKYYNYRDIPRPGTDHIRAKYGAQAIDEYTDSLKNYSAGIRYIPSRNHFAVVICRGNDHTEDNINEIRPIKLGASDEWVCLGNSTAIR
ncbi:type IV pilin protein [Crocosphaera sp. Alani8]|uniref:type IV pilin protein n=1 Tax=Crocosphaera sp. Alani8 TaxID=3038952 RepID=UPI00313B826F